VILRPTWSHGEQIVGESPAMRALSAQVDRVAGSDLPVLLRGETGTGKELLARAIHLRSPRREAPFVSQDCGALTESLLEDELFGHEPGAFTGAERRREGLFARAHAGTLFLDEVGEMSPSLQAKLLRVLQEREVRPLGGDRPRAVDVRIVAATNENLELLAQQGRFRQDLLFRLQVLEVHLPPLRERPEDIPLLADRFLRRAGEETGRDPPVLGERALDALLAHPWPGNVRELENAIRVAALFSPGPVLDPRTLPLAPPQQRQRPPEGIDTTRSYADLLSSLEAQERGYVQAVLAGCRGNKAEAARRLGVTRYALYRTLKRLGLELDDEQALEAELQAAVG
jgi:two-component system response regulator HydG